MVQCRRRCSMTHDSNGITMERLVIGKVRHEGQEYALSSLWSIEMGASLHILLLDY